MPRTYAEAPDVREIAEDAIAKWHPHLEDAAASYLRTDPMASKGRIVGAKVRKTSGLEHYLTGLDFVLMVNAEFWEVLEAPRRIALLDHELCHVKREDGACRLVGHDIEEFLAVVKRHGAWETGIKAFGEQLDLFASAAALDGAGAAVTFENWGEPPE